MSYKWILGLVFLMGCTSAKNVREQKAVEKLTIELISSTKKGEYFDFNFVIKNNTNKPVTILKHKGLDERKRNDMVISSAFYQMEFFPIEVTCESEPMFMDQEIMDNKVFKMDGDFVTIASKEKYLFDVKSEDYILGICNNKIEDFKVVLKYEPRKQYFQKEYFESNYKFAKNTQQYFEKLENTFQSTIVSDTLIIKY